MICYLIRHGQDDETVRGGWSDQQLTETGIQQAKILAEEVAKLTAGTIYSSDLQRAVQTAQIIGNKVDKQVTLLPEFRETNNGELAGMENTTALERYPGLFWNQLEWDQCYPHGESPHQFYDRIQKAWESFCQMILAKNEDVILVTHGGVIHVILSLIEGRIYSNKEKQRNIPHASIIALSYENGVWKET